ncbi:MAG TPA: hypothetical protein VKK81_15065 [Candidatus Binatia bacterium]|nr:hypothetical protein [Candidatus Binatia bacterium]
MAFTDEELQKIRKRLGTEEANAQPKKGLFTLRLRVGKILLLVLLSGLMAIPAFMLWNYSTFSPCGALTQAMHGTLMREAASKATTPAETVAREASAQLLFPVVDLRIEAMSPGECTKALVKFETLGENPFVDLFSAQPTP